MYISEETLDDSTAQGLWVSSGVTQNLLIGGFSPGTTTYLVKLKMGKVFMSLVSWTTCCQWVNGFCVWVLWYLKCQLFSFLNETTKVCRGHVSSPYWCWLSGLELFREPGSCCHCPPVVVWCDYNRKKVVFPVHKGHSLEGCLLPSSECLPEGLQVKEAVSEARTQGNNKTFQLRKWMW